MYKQNIIILYGTRKTSPPLAFRVVVCTDTTFLTVEGYLTNRYKKKKKDKTDHFHLDNLITQFMYKFLTTHKEKLDEKLTTTTICV